MCSKLKHFVVSYRRLYPAAYIYIMFVNQGRIFAVCGDIQSIFRQLLNRPMIGYSLSWGQDFLVVTNSISTDFTTFNSNFSFKKRLLCMLNFKM